VSWMRNVAGNPPSVALPFLGGMGHESAFDCHDTADSRVFGMAKTKQKSCCQCRCHGYDNSALVTT